ncbi:MAG: GHMP kinase, partial [Synergistaceae bacterium]|nr:GHMP kinase [Synergistaceae bacterium]
VIIHPTFRRQEIVVKYNQTEVVDDVRKLKHPIARQLLIDHNVFGVEIVSTADVPSGTGLSTSSAYTVGLINALYAFQGKYCSQEKIAREACELEIEELGEPIGKQDQYGTAVGGLKFIRFREDESVEVEPLPVNKKTLNKLDDNLLLFYTGLTHSAGEILREQNDNIASEEAKFNNLVKMTELAREMRNSLLEGDLESFGEILNVSWQLKRELAGKITNETIEHYYDIAMKSGALGGKLLGAGGGGFLLFYCDQDHQKRLRSALSDLLELPFNMENSGTKVIYIGEKDWD